MDKIALVTGASRGIGQAIAIKLAENNFFIVINYRKRREAALETLRQVRARGADGVLYQADVSEPGQVDEMFTSIEKEFGTVNVLVNNAGWGLISLVESTTNELWDRHIAVNLSSVFYCSRRALPGMIERKWGRIINITSIAGLKGLAGLAAYSAAKAGVIGFTRALAQEVAGTGVTVNAIAVGFAKTDMGLSFFQATGLPVEEFARKFTLTGDLVDPIEVGELVAFLASDKAKSITGEVIVIDGGQLLAPSLATLLSP